MIIKQILPILFLLQFISLSVVAETDCSVEETRKKWTQVNTDIQALNLNLSLALKGERLGNFSISDLFGHDYKVDESGEYLDKIKKQLKRDGVPIEYIGLKNCLIKLKQQEELQELFLVSQKTLELRTELLENDKKLSGSLQAQLSGQSEIPELKKEINEDRKKSELEREELERLTRT